MAAYQPQPPKGTSSIPVIVASCSMAVLLSVFVILISIVRPDSDNITLIGIVIAAIAPTTVGLLAYLKTIDNQAAVLDVHTAINGRLTQLLAMTEAASRAQGLAEGTQAGTVIAKSLVADTAAQLRKSEVVLP